MTFDVQSLNKQLDYGAGKTEAISASGDVRSEHTASSISTKVFLSIAQGAMAMVSVLWTPSS